MTDFLRERLKYELDEIALARSDCMLAEAKMVLAIDRGQFQDAQEAAHQGQVKAKQLHTMLAHIETVIGVEIQSSADDFEDSNLVYEGKVA